jgi:hypothetical protein
MMIGVFVASNEIFYQEHSHQSHDALELLGSKHSFLLASNFNYYGSKEEGKESSQEGSKEEEGINPFLPQNKNSPRGVFVFQVYLT